MSSSHFGPRPISQRVNTSSPRVSWSCRHRADAIGNEQVLIGIDPAHVTGVQPTVDHSRSRCFFVPPITLHEPRPARENLAIAGQFYLHPWERQPDRADLKIAAMIDKSNLIWSAEKIPMVKITSWIKAEMAPMANCHSNRIQM